MKETIGGWLNQGLTIGQRWLDKIRPERHQTKQANEHLRSLTKEIRELINNLYDTPPAWQKKVRYTIDAWELNIDCQNCFPLLLTLYPELKGIKLTKIYIVQEPELFTQKETPEIKIKLDFIGVDVNLHFSEAGKCKIDEELSVHSGPATFHSKREHKGGHISGAILRSQAIKEVLSTILSLKQSTRTPSNP
jgi:hypothetical protein